ncbi:hypothetical protein Tsubulata_046354 [Turnera subulata]|uniref:F-box domain-containing protein n=1 Tax=Turnera subulata TaxID=218843 RepID=A0A9Q0JQ33_9ROSI|nr:hypothetical protein Tsubulata_046354 [Turnera subulata]
MAASGNLSSSSGSSHKRKRDERLPVDEAKISTTSTDNCLLPEIVEGILSLLPNKSIHRFRSVSKSWSSLLVRVDFHQFRRKSTPPAETIPRVLKLLRSYSGSVYGPSPPPSHGFELSSYYPPDALGHTANTMESYPFQKFWLRSFVGSCNGLVCLEHSLSKPGVKNHSTLEMVVWNPFTGLYRKLSDGMTWFDWRYAHGFGYDSASDDYKVFTATWTNYGGVRVDIFSLKAGSWKEVENPARELQHLIRRDSMGLFLNGALHWEFKNEKDGLTKIIAFDLAEETFYDVPLPLSTHFRLSPRYHGFKYHNYEYYSMGVVGEYLCVCFLGTEYHCNPFGALVHTTNIINVWVMKEYCNEASWVLFVSYSPDDLTYVPNSIPPRFAKDGGYMILQYSRGCNDVLKWINNNPDEGTTDGAEEQYSNKIEFYCRHESLTAIPYTEALTSPYASTGAH